jgi:hypothetical protein
MATHDYVIDNQSGASFRADLNNALAAIVSQNSSSTEPATKYAYQYWVDTSVDPALIKQRNAANDGWVTLAEVNGQLLAKDGTLAKPSISFASDTSLGLRRNAADKLSIVTSGADRFTVDSGGNVGVGTTAPEADLHLANSANAVFQVTAGSSNTCTIRFGDTGDTNIGKIQYDNSADKLAFDTNNSTRLTILSDGKCGIGETTPTELLHVAGNIKTTAQLQIDGDLINNNTSGIGQNGYKFNNTGIHYVQRNVGASAQVFEVYGGSGKLEVEGDGDLKNTNNSYGQVSDSKLKENIVDASSQWEDIKGVRVRNFRFKESTGFSTHTQIGVVAQEIEAVSPGLVKETDDLDANGNLTGTTKSVSYSVLYMKAVKALQEAMDRIETLETKVAALEAGN